LGIIAGRLYICRAKPNCYTFGKHILHRNGNKQLWLFCSIIGKQCNSYTIANA
jgi:hypothetical protein